MKKIFPIAAALALLFSTTMSLLPAAAAPLWIERQFISDAELIDPIFSAHDEESAVMVDHAAWADFLIQYRFLSGEGVSLVNYGAVTPEDTARLVEYINSLAAIDTTTLSRDEVLAFWINLYNAVTVQRILEHYPVKSIRKIDDVWKDKLVSVNGVDLSLDDIENRIIRPVFNDPRIHYAVNCASIGCPNLAAVPYTGSNLAVMLEAGARDYVNHPRGVIIEDDDLTVSKIFGWYREDFGENEADVIEHLKLYANEELLAALRGFDDIDDYEYDWSLNDVKAPEQNQ